MLNKKMLIDTICNLGLGKYYDSFGYNVLEIPYPEYKANVDAVGALLVTYGGLGITTIDDYGNTVTDPTGDGEEWLVVVYDVEEWKENEII